MNQQMQNSNGMQTMFCGLATKQDVFNWQVAPGYSLIFLDPDGIHVYRKSLPFGTYQPIFDEYEKVRPVEQPKLEEPKAVDPDIASLKNEIESLKTMIFEVNEKVSKPYYNKKDGNK